MTKVLIATFSQNGSTKKIADQIALGLGSANFDVSQLSITENKSPDIKEYDIIGIGTPTYFFRPPFNIIDFVSNLQRLENKSTFVFISHGTNQGNCGNWIRAFGRSIASRYTVQSPQIEKFDPPTPFLYGLERMFVSRPLAKIMYSKTFRADNNCDNCRICIKKCPIGNISENTYGKLKWQSKCLLCATCELSCPKDAIHSALDWVIFAPFMTYNIRHSKNKKIPFVNVTHRKGKTVLT